MMRFGAKCPAWAIDAVSAAVTAAFLGGAAWITLVRGEDTRLELADLGRAMAAAEKDLAGMKAIHGRQQIELRQKREELLAKGHLPTEAPVEEYFQALGAMAGLHGLHVIRHQPLSAREYPGLLERRYAYEVSGTFPDLMRFLQGIEQSHFWADISYFRIQPIGPAGSHAGDRVASLTVSIFAATPSPAAAAEAGQG